VLVVPDARSDARFADNPAVARDNGIRFYAGAPLVTSDGFPVGTLCVVDTKPRRLTLDQVRALRALARQVTAHMELRHLAAKLNGAGERLLALERGMDSITGLVGGELRAPIEALRAYLGDLDRDRDAAPDPVLATAAAGIVRRHAAAFGRLADCLLGVAGGDRDGDLRMQHVDLTRLTVRAVEAVRPIADAKRIWILSRPGPDLPILADPVRLEQALMQLLFAAVKYTPDGGRVKVSTEVEAGPAVRVDDLDTTAGHASLFEHLYYGAIAQPHRPGGPDAGLAVTKRVLDVHHATLALSDRPGDCTSLHVVFPEFAAAG
jgi:signal transduction histidine kinase